VKPRRPITRSQREDHIRTLELLGRLVVGIPMPLSFHRMFVLFTGPVD
jgi:hypothetical protein